MGFPNNPKQRIMAAANRTQPKKPADMTSKVQIGSAMTIKRKTNLGSMAGRGPRQFR
jgi:hypothetical protein